VLCFLLTTVAFARRSILNYRPFFNKRTVDEAFNSACFLGDNNTTDTILIKTNDYDITSNTHSMKAELRQHQAEKDHQDWKEDSSSSMAHPQMRASMKKMCVCQKFPQSEEREVALDLKKEKQRCPALDPRKRSRDV